MKKVIVVLLIVVAIVALGAFCAKRNTISADDVKHLLYEEIENVTRYRQGDNELLEILKHGLEIEAMEVEPSFGNAYATVIFTNYEAENALNVLEEIEDSNELLKVLNSTRKKDTKTDVYLVKTSDGDWKVALTEAQLDAAMGGALYLDDNNSEELERLKARIRHDCVEPSGGVDEEVYDFNTYKKVLQYLIKRVCNDESTYEDTINLLLDTLDKGKINNVFLRVAITDIAETTYESPASAGDVLHDPFLCKVSSIALLDMLRDLEYAGISNESLEDMKALGKVLVGGGEDDE